MFDWPAEKRNAIPFTAASAQKCSYSSSFSASTDNNCNLIAVRGESTGVEVKPDGIYGADLLEPIVKYSLNKPTRGFTCALAFNEPPDQYSLWKAAQTAAKLRSPELNEELTKGRFFKFTLVFFSTLPGTFQPLELLLALKIQLCHEVTFKVMLPAHPSCWCPRPAHFFWESSNSCVWPPG